MEPERSFEMNGQTYHVYSVSMPMCTFWVTEKDDVCGLAVEVGKCSAGHPWVPSLHPLNWANPELS
jgi:hypothetical protein